MDRIKDTQSIDIPDRRTGQQTNNRRYVLLMLLGLISALTGLLLVNPASIDVLPACPFHSITGLKCPGCGSMRALHLMFRGEFEAAVYHNFIAILLFPVAMLSVILAVIRGIDLFDRLTKPLIYRIILAGVLIFFISRNVF